MTPAEWIDSFRTLSQPVLLLDASGDVLAYNPSFQEVFRAAPSQLQNLLQSSHPILHQPDVQRALRASIAERKRVRIDAIEGFVGLGSALALDMLIEPWNDDVHFVVWLFEHARLSELGQDDALAGGHGYTQIMLGGLMHEINNPLGGILGSAQILAAPELDDQDRLEFAEGIVNDVARIRSIMDVFSRTGFDAPASPEWFSLAELIFELMYNVERSGDAVVNWRSEIDIHLPQILADRTRLGQVVSNLLLNAVAFTGDDHIVAVRAGILHRSHRVLGSSNSWVQVRVEDSGAGIAGDEEKLFVPFYTTRAGGTGLGLAVSQAMVRSMGGTIEAGVSRFGGARFDVNIPVEIQT